MSTLKRFAPSKLFNKTEKAPSQNDSPTGSPQPVAAHGSPARTLAFSDATSASDTDSERSAPVLQRDSGSEKDLSAELHQKSAILKEEKSGGGSRKRHAPA